MRRRTRPSSTSEHALRSRPSKTTCPRVGLSSAPSKASSVVFPDPDDPVNSEKLPFDMTSETSRTAQTSASDPRLKHFPTLRASSNDIEDNSLHAFRNYTHCTR